jgi:hypothetical protein
MVLIQENYSCLTINIEMILVLAMLMNAIHYLTRLTRRVSLVEQELLILAEHLTSSPVFSGVVLIDL